MKLDMQERVSADELDKPSTPLRRSLGMLFGSWEVYLLLLVAAFPRLYAINTTEFDGDQAVFFFYGSQCCEPWPPGGNQVI